MSKKPWEDKVSDEELEEVVDADFLDDEDEFEDYEELDALVEDDFSFEDFSVLDFSLSSSLFESFFLDEDLTTLLVDDE